jgi:DnaB-like helicase N terminal domain/Protein of unknown function (DUF3987)
MPTIPQKRRKPPELPAAENAEKLILGSVLIGAADFADVAAALTADDFILEVDRRIFGRMAVMHGRGEPIDRPLLAQELHNHHELEEAGGLGYLVSLDDGLPHLPNIDGYIRQVRAMSVRRRALAEAYRIQARLQDLSVDLPVIQTDVAKLAETLTADRETEAPPSVPQWPELRPEAMHGPAGALVAAIAPHSEADPAALLLQTLVGFGSLIGRCGFYAVEGDRHFTNLYLVIVGASSKARKGTGWSRIHNVLSMVDEHWTERCLLSGVGSGEALIDSLDGEDGDRRRLIIEGELARLLSVIQREGQTLSPILRTTWDHGRADTHTRGAKERHVRDAHLSLIAHITVQELVRRLNDVELANGLANRVLFCCSKRSKLLPHGGGAPEVGEWARLLLRAAEHARRSGQSRMRFDAEAAELWESIYAELSAGRPGMLGSITNRSEAQCVRLSLIFALLDQANVIGAEHLRAALAVWDYCAASAAYVWGEKVGNPVADRILEALRVASAGMTRTDLSRGVFMGNVKAGELDIALNLLTELGMIRAESEATGGRSSTRFFPV